MNLQEEIDRYLDVAVKEKPSFTKKDMRFKLENIFKGIDFENIRFLDIGGGSGLLCY